MMKSFFAGLCGLFLFAGLAAQAQTGSYKKVDDALNERIRADVARHFASGSMGVESLFKQFCVCMPAYWDVIKGRGVGFRHGKPSHATDGTGMSTNDQQDMAALADQLSSDAGRTPVIRKLTEEEIKWLVGELPIEMEEPIFMVENKGAKFVVLMGEDDHTGNYFIVFVDLFTAAKN